MEILVKTYYGLENALADELKTLGINSPEVLSRAVRFNGSLTDVYVVNHWSRLALRVLTPLFSFNANNIDDLYQKALRFNWSKTIKPSQTFAITNTVKSKIFTHSKFVSLKLKDAIADFFTKQNLSRPSVDLEDPYFIFELFIYENQVTIYLDTSGDSLHKRGYRLQGHDAPLSETLAAGMLHLADWRGESALMDPFCGSGTLLFEAAMIAQNLPAGLLRKKYAFMRWDNFDSAAWSAVSEKMLLERKTKQAVPIIGRDVNAKLIKTLTAHLEKFEFTSEVFVETGDFFDYNPKLNFDGMVVFNPPYGERLSPSDLGAFYKEIGNKLKQRFQGSTAWMITGSDEGLKAVGLKPSRKISLFNGPIPCKFVKYELYSGSKRTDRFIGPQ